MKKTVIKIAIPALAVIMVVIIVFNLIQRRNAASIATVKTQILKLESLYEKLTLKGMVESNETRKIYSNLNYQIESIYFKVGDKVSKDDILCKLDTTDLELNIEERKAELSVSEQNSLLELTNNERLYNQASGNLTSGTNAQVNTANSNYETALKNYEIAQKNYTDAQKDYATGKNSVQLEDDLKTAVLDVETKKDDYESHKVLFNSGVVSSDVLAQKENALKTSENRVEELRSNIENAKENDLRNAERLAKELEKTEVALKNAGAALETSRVNSRQELENYRKNLESAKISNNLTARTISLNRLENQLQDATIKSPISGVITAIYKETGESANGLMFVIEDESKLIINTSIKEYDLNKVQLNSEVEITSDSVYEEKYLGKVIAIEPAATKDNQGETDTSAGSEFRAVIEILNANEKLKIGMNTNLNVITNKKENVLSVPYDSIRKNENEEYYILVPTISDNSYVAKEVKVEKGDSFNFRLEISGEEVTEGLEYIVDISKLEPNSVVRISEENTEDKE